MLCASGVQADRYVCCSLAKQCLLTARTAKHLQALLTRFQSLPLTEDLHSSLLKFTVACLTAGDMALWMGPGRKVLERAWDEMPTLALDMTGALSELNWGGWKLLALPHVLRRTAALLETQPQKTLEMLSALHKDLRLDAVDATWNQSVQSWVDARFEHWQGSQEQVGYMRSEYVFSLITLPLDV